MAQWLSSIWRDLLAVLQPVDLIDIGVVAFLVYLGLTWLWRQVTFAASAFLGSLLLLYVLARWLGMRLTLEMYRVGVAALVLGFLIVFKDELRSGLERLISGRRDTVGGDRSAFISDLSEALSLMSSSRTGALLVLKGRQPVEHVIRGGIRLEGDLSVPLVLSLFNHHAPAHDGAMILRERRVERFAAHLPLSSNLQEVGGRGTRHTAALGLSECSDALVLVVSEERGTVSAAENGILKELASTAEYQQVLERFLSDRHPKKRQSAMKMISLGKLGMALLSVLIAVVLWSPFAGRIEHRQQEFQVPVAFRAGGDDWVIDNIQPAAVRVTLTGRESDFSILKAEKLVQTVEILEIAEGHHSAEAQENQLEGVPAGLTVTDINPRKIRFRARKKPEPAEMLEP